jgi:hypothetical protein
MTRFLYLLEKILVSRKFCKNICFRESFREKICVNQERMRAAAMMFLQKFQLLDDFRENEISLK